MKRDTEGLILWSDDALLAVNKPSGLLVIRGGFNDSPYLAQMLQPDFGRVWVVHRLDRQTSGVLVFARTAETHRNLNTQFQEHTTQKVYHALVHSTPPWDQHTVDLALRRDGDRRHRTIVDPERGKPSTTHLRVLRRYGKHALIEATPTTGRTHQIRAHLAAIGLPITGDALYGGGQGLYLSDMDQKDQEVPNPLIERVALHALSLTIGHPTTGERLTFKAPYPTDMAAAVDALATH